MNTRTDSPAQTQPNMTAMTTMSRLLPESALLAADRANPACRGSILPDARPDVRSAGHLDRATNTAYATHLAQVDAKRPLQLPDVLTAGSRYRRDLLDRLGPLSGRGFAALGTYVT